MEIASIEPRKTDVEMAAEYDKRLRTALEPVRALLDEAKRNGLLLEFQLGQDMYGRSAIMQTGVVRRLI